MLFLRQKKVFSVLFRTVAFPLLCTLNLFCAHQNQDSEQLQGLLFKDKYIKPFIQDRQKWFMKLEGSDPVFLDLAKGMENQDWQKTRIQAEAILKARPHHSGALMVLASAYVSLAEYELAMFYAQQILLEDPDNVAAQNILGICSYARADGMPAYKKALDLFKLAFSKSRSEVAAGLNLGYLYLELGDAKAAQQVFSRVAPRCAGCSEALLGLAVALTRQGLASEAKSYLAQVVEKNPETMAAWYQLALYYRHEENDLEKSSAFAKKILDQKEARDSELVEKARLLWYDNKEMAIPAS